ncbi:hypothetical protein D9M71_626170 [compost metagenome]
METRTVTDDTQADVVVVEALGLAAQRREEQLHQRTDLFGGALPVFAGEGEQGQYLDPGLGTDFDDRANGVDTRLVPGNAGQQAFLRPAVVAIHDDRDMTRHRGRRRWLGLFH